MRTRRSCEFILLGCLLSLLPAFLQAEELPLSTLSPLPRFSTGSMDVSQPDPLQSLARFYTTPKAIAEFLHREFTFKTDQELFGQIEYWQTPQEFLAHRAGDCEDYAIFARELLVRNGYEAFLFSLFGEEGYAHTVCVFVDEQGRYNVLNQDKLRYYHAKTLEALASQMYPAWTFGGITEQAGIRGRLVKEITNPRPAHALASMHGAPSLRF